MKTELKMIKIQVGNIRAKWNNIRREQIDSNNALTIGTVTDFIGDIGLEITQLEVYLDKLSSQGKK